jgi:uncharacterized LabA/DUF88 family protein
MKARHFARKMKMAYGFGLRDDQRTALFIDGPNLFMAAKLLQTQIDYRSLLTHFNENSNLLRASYYSTVVETPGDQYISLTPLLDFLDYNGYTVVKKMSREYTDAQGNRKAKNHTMKVEMTIDMIELAPRLDHVVLFSGDGDLLMLVDTLKRKGVRTTIVSTVHGETPVISDDMRRIGDSFVDLHAVMDIIGKPQTTR